MLSRTHALKMCSHKMSGKNWAMKKYTGLIYNFYRLYLKAPEHPGKLRMERLLAGIIFPKEGVPYKVKAGVLLLLHPRDWIEYLLIKTGNYEPVTLDFLRRNLKTGDTAFFAGVNFGLHVVVAASFVGRSGKVVGIEPQPRSLFRTLENLKLNRLEGNVTLVSGALGAGSKILPMEEAPLENSGSASFSNSTQHSALRVCVQPVNEIAGTLKCYHPKVFLIDVEGFERMVLSGFGSEFRPDYLIIEINREILDKDESSEADLFHQVSELGYEIFSLKGAPAVPGMDLEEANVVAVRKGSSQPSWN